ncbi:MAG: aspartate aminotransferase family protein [Phycisphaerales bacterium]
MLTKHPTAELPVYARLNLTVVGGRGARLLTDDGREIVDFYAGHAVSQLGYNHPRLTAAIAGQAEQLIFQTNAVHHPGRDAAIAALVDFAPEGLDRAFLVNSGAEANENALRLAFLHAAARGEPRTRVIAVAGGFHGRTAAASACGPGTGSAWYGFPRAPFDVTVVPFNGRAALAAAMGPDVAAVILEPVQGVAGARALDPEFVADAAELAAECGAAFIADEVQCGTGRTGTRFAVESIGVQPDILTAAKGLGGGFPIGAVLTTEAFASTVANGHLGTTFGAAPMACAAMQAVIDTIDDALLARVNAVSARLHAECITGPITAVQGRGLLLGLRTGPPAAEVRRALLERNVLVGSAADPHIVRLTPPLTVEDADIDQLIAALRELPS